MARPTTGKWQRDPAGMRRRILDAAKAEFATHGLAGARVERIADAAGANKRMLYYHVGKKDALYLAVLEEAYEDIRAAERRLDLETLEPADAIARLVTFTWDYYLENPEFLSLLNTENLAQAQHLRRSTRVTRLHSPFVALLDALIERGCRTGVFRQRMDPVQLYISIAALAYFYLSNTPTLSVIFDRDLKVEEARRERLDHMIALVLGALTGSPAETARREPLPA